ncbi:MAG: hypothetical protein NC300_12495 [Bacteroidales bacterium]|nr:hypothetical protein [Clostridium sp.]MCM1204953.1 hypothetical protein [Bacteroidales bacterium]
MDEIVELIMAVQILAAAGAGAKIVYLVLSTMHEEETAQRNRKIRNVLMALILIETAVSLGALIKGYYTK